MRRGTMILALFGLMVSTPSDAAWEREFVGEICEGRDSNQCEKYTVTLFSGGDAVDRWGNWGTWSVELDRPLSFSMLFLVDKDGDGVLENRIKFEGNYREDSRCGDGTVRDRVNRRRGEFTICE